jgi:hypothetical protein
VGAGTSFSGEWREGGATVSCSATVWCDGAGISSPVKCAGQRGGGSPAATPLPLNGLVEPLLPSRTSLPAIVDSDSPSRRRVTDGALSESTSKVPKLSDSKLSDSKLSDSKLWDSSAAAIMGGEDSSAPAFTGDDVRSIRSIDLSSIGLLEAGGDEHSVGA